MGNVTRLINLVHTLGQFITVIAILGGIGFGAAAVFILFDAAKPASSSQGKLRYLPWTLIACAFLIQIGSSVSALRQTTFASDGAYPTASAEPYTWTANNAFSSHNQKVAMATLLVDFMALFGYYAIVRGIWMLPKINDVREPADKKKVIAFILGGTFMLQPATVASHLAYYFSILGPWATFLHQAA